MFFGQVGKYELLIIAVAFLFLILGVPALGAIAARLGSGTAGRIRRWLSSLRG